MFLPAILALSLAVPAAPPQIPYGMGYLPSDSQQRATFKSKGLNFDQWSKAVKAAPPPKYELQWMPRPHPAGQGMRGTCVAWACAYAAKSCLEAQKTETLVSGPDRFFSPTFLYSQRPNRGSEGMHLTDAVYILYAHGCLPWSEMPYLEATADYPPNAEQDLAARTYQVADWAVLDPCTSDKLKLALSMDLPVVLGILATEEFVKLEGNTVFQDFNPEHGLGGHALCAVGYDDRRQAVHVVNSWGREWGSRGYGWISYDLLDKRREGNPGFCTEAVAILDAPCLTTKVTVSRQGPNDYTWTVSVLGTAPAISQVDSVEYLLPAGYEPAVIRRSQSTESSAELEHFSLRSSDLEPRSSSSPLEVWVQFRLKTTKRMTFPRPVLVPCGKSTATALAGSSQRPPPGWPYAEPSREPVSPVRPQPAVPSHGDADAQVVVPTVVGLESGIATLRLMSVGLQVQLRRDAETAASARPGSVLQQSPVAGTSVSKGATVTLTTP
jgi:hypothetical protein